MKLLQMSFFNTLAIGFISAGSGLIFCTVGIWANAAFAEKMTPAGEVLSKFVGPALLVLAVFAFIGARFALKARGTTWEAIQKESVPIKTVIANP
ncbi:MAG: hypothetical protein E6K60_08250 [Nitrospirae bacterium]|nr:MAG: hypothetical protein E6K60_08250 [Nitrospirota bacterium]